MATNINTKHALGIDLGGTKIEALLLDSEGRSLWRQRVVTPQRDYRATLRAIAVLVTQAEREAGARDISVGIGTPGSATANGLMRNANSTCLNGKALQRDLETLLQRPVRLANDANCLALSEATDGAGTGTDVVFAVVLGTGVGGGLVVNGRLLPGANSLAGEWGHNPLPWADCADTSVADCYCGKRGCIETWLSGPALARDHAVVSGQSMSAPEIAQRAAQGDADCEATLQRYESRLARAFAMVINLLDPQVIVVGGGLSQLDRLYVNVPKLWARHVFSAGPSPRLQTKLRQSAHGDSSGVRGAAWLWQSADLGHG